MIEMTRDEPVATFKVFDREGQAIGEVLQPRSMPAVGRGAETVLLIREKPADLFAA